MGANQLPRTARPTAAVRASAQLMGADAEVTLVGGTIEDAHACLNVIAALEAEWSRFRPDSALSRLSRGETVFIDEATRQLLDWMQRGARATAGAFDPTLLREIIDLGYAHSLEDPNRKAPRPPDPKSTALITDLTISDPMRLPPGLAIDPGGIGKGAAADLTVAFARDRGASGVLVNIGGDLAAWGEAPEPSAWRVAVEHPLQQGETLGEVRIAAGGIATSSQLKRRFQTLGRSESHVLDAHTGRSVAGEVLTVTVIAGAAWFAEVCTKPGFVWPVRDFLDWLPTVEAAGLLVTREGDTYASSNWAGYR
ncbi:MAG: FAD:protein FMN transferase [Agromyces sp.]